MKDTDFWGYVALGWFALIAILLGYLIYFVTGIYAETIDNYNECIKSKIPAFICEVMYPPLNIQGASY